MPRFYTVADQNRAYPRTYPNRPATMDTPPDSWAMDVKDAARLWAEYHHNDYGCPDTMTALVTDPDGKRWRVEVCVETVPSFHVFRAPKEVT